MLLTEGMTAAPRIVSITDETEWRAETLTPIEVKLATCIYSSDWLADEPSAFDTEHSATARLFATNSGISPTILGPFAPDLPGKSIPYGYTVLDLFEKRAVIADGKLVRLWSHRFAAEDGLHNGGGMHAITEGTTHGHLSVRLDDSIGHAVGQAQVLSARMNGAPVIVARLLSRTDWHGLARIGTDARERTPPPHCPLTSRRITIKHDHSHRGEHHGRIHRF